MKEVLSSTFLFKESIKENILVIQKTPMITPKIAKNVLNVLFLRLSKLNLADLLPISRMTPIVEPNIAGWIAFQFSQEKRFVGSRGSNCKLRKIMLRIDK
ncbi:MAG: hypothetical protein OXB93_02705 [Cytophagales bacterium]|nr:hypothetical protein [Cytophagales bacterium]